MNKFWEGLPPQDIDTFHKIAGLYFYDSYTAVLSELTKNWEGLAGHEALRPELYRMKGYCLVELGEIAQGLRTYKKAIDIDPDNSHLRRNLESIKPRAYKALEKYFARRQWRRLQDLSQAVVDIDEEDFKAEWFYAVSLDEEGQPEKALEIFDSLIKRDPNESNHWRSKALALHHMNRSEEGIRVCAEGVSYLRAAGRGYSDVKEILDWLTELSKNNGQGIEKASEECQLH